MKKIRKCPINGTVDGYSVNEQDQHENHSMRVRETKKERNLKKQSRREAKTMMEEVGRGHDLDIYLGPTAGGAMAAGSGRLQRPGSTVQCRNRRRLKRLKRRRIGGSTRDER